MCNVIPGTAGNDTLGFESNTLDKMVGGTGNDTYYIDGYYESVVEKPDEGNDTIRIITNSYFHFGSMLSYTIPVNVENLNLAGLERSFYYRTDIEAWANKGNKVWIKGNDLNNSISSQYQGFGVMAFDGGGGQDTILGSGANDILFGGNDDVADWLEGGEGVDTYIIRDNKDIIVDHNEAMDINGDTYVEKSIIKLDKSFTGVCDLSDYNDELLVSQFDTSAVKSINIIGRESESNNIAGGAGNDSIAGGTKLDNLTGGAGNDTLYGGNDTLADVLSGGLGNDTYLIKDTKDTIIDTSGSNTLKLDSSFENPMDGVNLANFQDANILTVDATLWADGTYYYTGNESGVTNFFGSSGDDIFLSGNGNDYLVGNDGDDMLNSLEGNDLLFGGIGNDYLGGGYGNDKLYGGEGDDFLGGGYGNDYVEGGVGNDTLSAWGGTDVLNGGDGNDVYELSGLETKMTIKDSSGVDTVKLYGKETQDGSMIYTYQGGSGSTISLAGYKVIENLNASAVTLTTDRFNLVGNALANSITGSAGDDTLYGGSDTIADVLTGGSGSDTYIIKDTNDNIADLGANTIKLDKSFAPNALNLQSVYTTGINKIDATDVKKALTLVGKASATTIIGGSGNDSIIGGGGNDVLNGGKGNDTLVGGAGANTLIGGLGNDTYLVADQTEFIVDDGGVDTVKLVGTETSQGSGIYTYSDSTTTDGVSVIGINALTYDGVTAVASIENFDASAITDSNASFRLYGNDLNNMIKGGAGSDSIYSGAGNDNLFGGFGDDYLYGGTGKDVMTGGAGADVYSVDNSSDKVVELVQDNVGLWDRVQLASVYNSKAYTLAANVEDLDASLYSMGIKLTGNLLGNKIDGGAGADNINGGAGDDYLQAMDGNDTITGGLGNDTYSFLDGDGLDLITATDAGDRLLFTVPSISKDSDVLFYKDSIGNFCIDYTDGGIGTDVITIAKGKYNYDTTIRIADKEIHIGEIIQALGSSINTMDADASGTFNYADKAAQAANVTLAAAWDAMPPL